MARLVGRSLGGAKSENERKEMRMDGQTDGQTGGQKVKCPRGELNDVFEFGRYHPSSHPADERDERVALLLPSASLREDLYV